MFAEARLNELRGRRELLITHADLHRRLLCLETESAAETLSWIDPAYRLWQRMKPLGWIIAPVAGFLLARRGGSLLLWGVRGLDFWKMVRRFLPG